MVSIVALRRFVLVSVRVRAAAGGASNTVVSPVERLIPASVVFGRMLVSISLEGLANAKAGLDSLLADKEPVTSGVPSARQKASVSSVSVRWQAGQRFIFFSASCSLPSSYDCS